MAFFCILIVLLVVSREDSRGEGFDVPVILEYDVEMHKAVEDLSATITRVRYTFAVGITKIEHESESVFIDYKRLQLHTYTPGNERCEQYTLRAPDNSTAKEAESGQIVVYEMVDKLGSMKITEIEGGPREFRGYPCKLARINWGWKAQMMRTAVTPKIEIYGRSFVPGKTDYQVTSSIDRIDDLFSLSAAYEQIFRDNPLLRQVDPLGVIRSIQGIPIQILNKERTESLRSVSRSGAGQQGIRLPSSCRITE